MVCLTCNHVINPDREMANEQQSNDCKCSCHPWNKPKQEEAGVECPTCKRRNTHAIYRPEIYEFDHYCRDCERGFNA